MAEAKEPWEEWVPEVDEKSWYADQNPEYSGELPITPEKTEAARRFVSEWLERDNHGFIIPGGEWGLSLKHWLHHLVAATGPFETHEELSSKAAAVAPNVYRVDVTLDTTMWNEGFDQADYPWLRLYTDNKNWADSVANTNIYQPLAHSIWGQDYTVRVVEVPLPSEPDAEQLEWENVDNYQYGYEQQAHTARFTGFLGGLTNAELDKVVADRIAHWEGI